MKNKKAIILTIIGSITLLVLIIGATYAYFQASGGTGTSANLRVTTYTTDIITFEVGSNINIEKIELIKHEHIEEEINHCTLFTEKYNNYIANGLLSGNRKSKNINL